MKKIALVGLGFGAAILFSGCATIMDGKTQKINLVSSKNTTVDINGQVFNAPGIITVQRPSSDGILKIKDCENKTVLLKREVNPTFFVNILSGGAFGSTTDYNTDAMWK